MKSNYFCRRRSAKKLKNHKRTLLVISGVGSHDNTGKHTRDTEHAKKFGKTILIAENVVPPIFFACSVTPCMLTTTMLPEI